MKELNVVGVSDEHPKYKLQWLLLSQVCIVKHFAGPHTKCMQFKSILHFMQGTIEIINTVYGAQYRKFILKVIDFALHFSRSSV